MSKRKGHLYERMMTLENFVLAEKKLGNHKKDNRMAKHIAANAEKYGKALFEKVSSGNFKFHESKKTTIVDTYKGKERNLMIPCLEDQAVQQAWMNIATPYIERRNYYYNCGSIPGAGQIRSVKALQRWLKDKRNKYAAVLDIRKFYETCPHNLVYHGLKRIFKDERFVQFGMLIVSSMSDTGIGLAIGHPSSHWFANVALMELDKRLHMMHGSIKHTRYMDDIAMVSPNKRHLRKAMHYVIRYVSSVKMTIKHNWQLFRIKVRGLQFLSYRFFNGYTILAKRLMFRIADKIKCASKGMTVGLARRVVSYMGILKHCDSYNFRNTRVYPYVNPKQCRRMISRCSLKHSTPTDRSESKPTPSEMTPCFLFDKT